MRGVETRAAGLTRLLTNSVQLALQLFLQVAALGVLAYSALDAVAPALSAQTFIWPFVALIVAGPLLAWRLGEPSIIFSISATNAFLYALTLSLCLSQAQQVGGSWPLAMALTALCFVCTTLLLLAMYFGGVLAWARFVPSQVVVGVTLLGTGLSICEPQIQRMFDHTPW